MNVTWVLALALGCGGAERAAPEQPAAPAREAATAPAEPDTAPEARPPEAVGPWWHAPEPACPGGDTAVQSLTWGRLVWCGDAGGLAARRHQRDLGRLARCVRDAVAALQSEPEPNALAEFVTRAVDAEVAPALCGSVRLDPGSPDVSTHDGRGVELHRSVEGEDLYDDGTALRRVRYRFSCASCNGFAETTVPVAAGGGHSPTYN